MKNDQRGLGVVWAIALLLIIGIVGSVNIYIRRSDKSGSVTAFDECLTAVYGEIRNDVYYPTCTYNRETFSNPDASEPDNGTLGNNNDSINTFKTYEGNNLSLRYPEDWIAYQEADQPGWIFFKSPDYEPATELGPSVKAGYWLEVRVSQTIANESYGQDLKNAPMGQEAHGGSYETIKIDGRSAILSNTKTHGTYWYATAYDTGKTYYFRLNAPNETKPEVKELFKTILATVRVK